MKIQSYKEIYDIRYKITRVHKIQDYKITILLEP